MGYEIIIIEHSGFDGSTTVAVIAAIVAVLALVLNYLTIPRPFVHFAHDAGTRQVYVWNAGNADMILVSVRIVARRKGERGVVMDWEDSGILPTSKKGDSPLIYELDIGQTIEVRYVQTPFLRWRRVKKFTRDS